MGGPRPRGAAPDGPGLEGESTTVLRPGSNAGSNQSAESEPTQPVSGDEPTAPVDDDGQRTTTIGATADERDCVRYVREALGVTDLAVEIEDVQR